MARFLSIVFALLFSLNAGAAYAPPTDSLNLSGLTVQNALSRSGFKVLHLYGSGNGCYSTPREGFNSTGYSVPVGKTFTILQMRVTSSAVVNFGIGKATSDNTSCNGTQIGTHTYVGTGSSTVAYMWRTVSAGAVAEMYPSIVIPATYYPVFAWGENATLSGEIWGIEQ